MSASSKLQVTSIYFKLLQVDSTKCKQVINITQYCQEEMSLEIVVIKHNLLTGKDNEELHITLQLFCFERLF